MDLLRIIAPFCLAMLIAGVSLRIYNGSTTHRFYQEARTHLPPGVVRVNCPGEVYTGGHGTVFIVDGSQPTPIVRRCYDAK